jgi:hypothetical protein
VDQILRDQQYAVVIETKRARVCRSNGQDLDGIGRNSIAIMEYLQMWLAHSGGYVSMDKSGSLSARTGAAFDWYDEAWKCKLQKYLFQVRSDWIRTSLPLKSSQCWQAMARRKTRHCVLANEQGFILLQRSSHDLLLSKLYSCRPSTPEENLEMMTDLSFFIAHALCERFPSNDNSFQPPDPLPATPAASDTPSSSSASSPNTGTSRTHAKTDSQATIRGPVDATIMVRVVQRTSRPRR